MKEKVQQPKNTDEKPPRIVITPELLERAKRVKESIQRLEDATSIQATRSIDHLIIDL